MGDCRNSKKLNGSFCSGTSRSCASGSSCSTGVYDTVWECVIPYVKDPRDRGALSLVCKRWCAIDAITRKHVTMALCYTAMPQRLSRRFPQLESLKLKGKPRAAMFNLIPEDWGGYVTPWVEEIVRSFGKMKALHFRRMIVKDSDLELLANSAAGKVLEVLKLDKCSGFSTDGLLLIGRLCRFEIMTDIFDWFCLLLGFSCFGISSLFFWFYWYACFFLFFLAIPLLDLLFHLCGNMDL